MMLMRQPVVSVVRFSPVCLPSTPMTLPTECGSTSFKTPIPLRFTDVVRIPVKTFVSGQTGVKGHVGLCTHRVV